jgi:hypothetical protein
MLSNNGESDEELSYSEEELKNTASNITKVFLMKIDYKEKEAL